jgi:hypothetical protein
MITTSNYLSPGTKRQNVSHILRILLLDQSPGAFWLLKGDIRILQTGLLIIEETFQKKISAQISKNWGRQQKCSYMKAIPATAENVRRDTKSSYICKKFWVLKKNTNQKLYASIITYVWTFKRLLIKHQLGFAWHIPILPLVTSVILHLG